MLAILRWLRERWCAWWRPELVGTWMRPVDGLEETQLRFVRNVCASCGFVLCPACGGEDASDCERCGGIGLIAPGGEEP